MDSRLHEVAKRGIDHALPLDTILSSESPAFDAQREMAFASRIVAAVAVMELAVVGQLDACRMKRELKPVKHFGCDRSGSLGIHRA